MTTEEILWNAASKETKLWLMILITMLKSEP